MSIQTDALRQFIHYWGKEVTPEVFYRSIFPEGALSNAHYRQQGKYAGRFHIGNMLSCYINDDLSPIITAEPSRSHTMNCISYAGSGNTQMLARECYALFFRVCLPNEIEPRYVENCLHDLKWQVDKWGMSHPRNPQICPTYVVTDKSMKDVFFCYVMHEPIPMYYGLHKKIQRLYDALSRAIHHMWDSYYYDDVTRQVVYKYECFKPQPADIFKTYPVVGTRLNGETCVAYEVGSKYTLDDLNMLVPKVARVEIYDPQMSLEEAKEKYPEWYHRRIEQHRKSSGNRYFKSDEAVYRWFLKTVNDNIDTVALGAMEALASYACKCQIERLTLSEDLEGLHSALASRFPEDQIAEHHERALEFYAEAAGPLTTWGLDAINKWSGLNIQRSKRNGLPQKLHLKKVHEACSYKNKVRDWVKTHPSGTQTECAAELDMSRQTACKWWPKEQAAAKNPCPLCGCEMERVKEEPWFWHKKGKKYTRINQVCSNAECGYVIKGRAYETK